MTVCSAKFQTNHKHGQRFDRNLILEGHQAVHNNNGKSTNIFHLEIQKSVLMLWLLKRLMDGSTKR